MLTPQRIQEHVETVIERKGIEGVGRGPFTVDVEDYGDDAGDIENDEYSSELSWYFALAFYEDDRGEIQHYIAEDVVDGQQYYQGFSYHNLGKNEVGYLGAFPVEPGRNEFTLEEVLDEIFYEGYDLPTVNSLDDESVSGFVS